jgi:integrase
MEKAMRSKPPVGIDGLVVAQWYEMAALPQCVAAPAEAGQALGSAGQAGTRAGRRGIGPAGGSADGGARRQITVHRGWKTVRAHGERLGLPELHPHALCHSCGAELLLRTGGNLQAVEARLRHADTQTTAVYTRFTQADRERVVSVFDNLRT